MNEMKPSALIRVGMASMLTLGFASSLFYYNEINKKEEVVLMDQLYDPSTYKEEVVELNLSKFFPFSKILSFLLLEPDKKYPVSIFNIFPSSR